MHARLHRLRSRSGTLQFLCSRRRPFEMTITGVPPQMIADYRDFSSSRVTRCRCLPLIDYMRASLPGHAYRSIAAGPIRYRRFCRTVSPIRSRASRRQRRRMRRAAVVEGAPVTHYIRLSMIG